MGKLNNEKNTDTNQEDIAVLEKVREENKQVVQDYEGHAQEGYDKTEPSTFADTIHQQNSLTGLGLCNRIYDDWLNTDKSEKRLRRAFMWIIFIFVIIQFVVAVILMISNQEISDTVFVSFFAAILVQFTGVIFVMAKYFYSERSTKPLEVVAALIQTIGQTNRDYNNEKENEKA
ncbi:MAG: hypothetical protein FWE34_04100 [Defluviitaleaceae bacterium]|nr:hypothetical protein [Defluviitaleaceae bacterium]